MPNFKQLIVPALTALVVALLVVGFFYEITKPAGLPAGTATTPGTNGIPTVLSGGSQPSYVNALEASESLISDGPIFLLDITYKGGTTAATAMRSKTIKQNIVSGTSTPCAIANPFTATSSVTNFALNLTVATTSAITWAIGTSTTQYATTTTMLTNVVAANTQSTMTWNPGSNNAVLSSGQFIVAGAGSGTTAATGAFGTGIVVTGTCEATFETD